jgi:hypothetical protein
MGKPWKYGEFFDTIKKVEIGRIGMLENVRDFGHHKN